MDNVNLTPSLARAITKAASPQTYYTIRFLADRERMLDAYRAYAYFRWVYDVLDAESDSQSERSVFIHRQKSILEKCYRGEYIHDATLQEQMLAELIKNDTKGDRGLRSYLQNMMAVMIFDAGRRGRLISAYELNKYSSWLATAVTEAMHYFIGHDGYSPENETRYLAVTGAHITHMLRDTFEDMQSGYFNIPAEMLDAGHILPQDVHSKAYRIWVEGRVHLARTYFKAGREYLNQVENPRCRLAGHAYTARFESVLDAIEEDGYFLRASYAECNGLAAFLRARRSIFTPLVVHQEI
jgi:phytoene/squalene synthetase